MTTVNRRITLAARPVGFPKLSDFRLVYSALPSPGPGEVLVRSIYLSLDPYQRRLMGDDPSSNGRAIAIGEVIVGGGVAVVVESQDSSFHARDAVEGMFGWQEFAVAKGSDLRKIDLSLAPITTALGVLGMPGLKAFFGLLDVCYPQRGETVVVSGATGAVGMLAGQIALLEGCRVVGIASSSDADISWLLDELGFDAAFNQSFDADYDARLAELCPDGIDVYFDDVGGAITDAALRRINGRARVSICGQSSQDNLEEPGAGPRWLQLLIDREARVQGFLVSGYAERYPEGRRQLTSWLAQGKLKYREDVAQGIEAAPQAFIAMLRGTGHGGQLVRLQGMWPDEIQGLAG